MSAHRLDEHPGEVKVALRRRCEERRDLPGESRSVLAEDSSEGAEETRAILLEDSPCPWAGGGRAGGADLVHADCVDRRPVLEQVLSHLHGHPTHLRDSRGFRDSRVIRDSSPANDLRRVGWSTTTGWWLGTGDGAAPRH